MMYKRGDIVTYQSPAYQQALRVRLTVRLQNTPLGEPGWDAVIVTADGQEDIAGFFFTSVWCTDSQILGAVTTTAG